MRDLLWVVPFAPYAGFLILALLGRWLPRPAAAFAGVGAVGVSLLATLIIGKDFLAAPDQAYVLHLWDWITAEGFSAGVTLRLDGLSMVFTFVITLVGFVIHIYSAGFMKDDEGYSRFFSWMNLFVGSMLMLVLADNILLLYLGWEGVGLCSYLLIGYWYRDPANGRAARKAFIVTRAGDAAMALGFILLYTHLGTLDISTLSGRAAAQWAAGSPLAVAAAALLLAGAVGKSAQIPLQVWLPDAMAGPTPVSALIHAATMVTAGVYLIARMHAIFLLAPPVMTAVSVIGAVTLLTAGLSALAQTDIKRVLAYSTISQIGYMFLALGAGAWAAAIFHFLTHAFFKALLFLGAGAVITSLDREHDIFRMGGLRRQMPLVFITFLAGAASLSAVPFVTSGFFSKEEILSQVWALPGGGPWLWSAGIAGAFITSLYTFRLVFIVFFGRPQHIIVSKPGPVMTAPLVILAVLSTVAGLADAPVAGSSGLLSGLLGHVLPVAEASPAGIAGGRILQAAAMVASIGGICLAYLMFILKPEKTAFITGAPAGALAGRLLKSGWGFDRMYDLVLVRPFVWLGRVNRDDVLDLFFLGVAWSGMGLNRTLSLSQSGKVRWYAMGIGLGAVLILGAVLFL